MYFFDYSRLPEHPDFPIDKETEWLFSIYNTDNGHYLLWGNATLNESDLVVWKMLENKGFITCSFLSKNRFFKGFDSCEITKSGKIELEKRVREQIEKIENFQSKMFAERIAQEKVDWETFKANRAQLRSEKNGGWCLLIFILLWSLFVYLVLTD